MIRIVPFSPTCGKTRTVHNSIPRKVLCGILLLCASGNEASEEAQVRLIATGGTIAEGRSGSLTAKELGELVPELKSIAHVSADDYLSIGSSQMTPELQFGLAQRVNALFRDDPRLFGIVITHGTDSLEETAFLLDLVVEDERPVVVTGAMRAPREPDSDASRNLVNAVRLAASRRTRDVGVIVTMNDEIHAARNVRKTHTVAVDAFASSPRGPMGYVDSGKVYITHRPAHRLTLDVDAIEPRVSLVRLYTGSDGSLIRAAVESGQRGIVVEAFGRGNAPPVVMDAVRHARAKDVTVVFTSRTGAGRVKLDETAKRLGVISGEDLDGLKARLVLVAALASTQDPETLQSYFRRLAGSVKE